MSWRQNKSPILPVIPGEILKKELKMRGIKQNEFASSVGLRPSHLSEIIKGTRPINDQLALKLEDVFDIKAETWLRLQAVYTRNLKEIETLEISEQYAINELRSYNETIDVKTILKRFDYQDYSNSDRLAFLTDKMMLPSGAELSVRTKVGGLWRKSEKVGKNSRMINTWACMARYTAKDIVPQGVFNKENIPNLITELVEIFNDNHNTIARSKVVMDKYGIIFCVVDKVEKASVDGYSFINNGIPAIIVTCRIPKIDSFAFSILHELGHIALHINEENDSFISFDGNEIDDMEKEADKFASEALIPSTIWNKLPAMPVHNAFLLQKACTQWALKQGINKWFVMGRISHETGMYKFKSDKTHDIN